MEHITLETHGNTYNNITDIVIHSRNITTLQDLISDLPTGLNYTVETMLSINGVKSTVLQGLDTSLHDNGKRFAIKPSTDGTRDQLYIVMARDKELAIANEILGKVDGKTGFIILRVVNVTDNDIKSIKKHYDVERIVKIT
ncbi:hypothetical protein [Methanobrevibacter filiformis]|nr:hypothetical protein [Methanobrevibacter filiformis]